MKKAEAMRIFKNLKDENYTVEERVEAIVDVATMETHNSVRKDNMIEAILFLAEVLKNVLEEGELSK